MHMTKSVSSAPYTIDAFFAGVGGIELGFQQTGEFRVVYANEFDKNARETYMANHPDTPLDGRDIHEVSPDEIPDSDVIMGGFPCQAFSIAGYRKGFEDDRGDLFFELLKMVKAKKPRVVFIENVKNLVTHDHGNTFKVIREALVENGYYIKWAVLNGKDYNIPQNRERIYVVGFKHRADYDRFAFPEPVKLTKTIHDIIDFAGQKDERYYYRDGKQPFYDKLVPAITSQDTIYQWRRQYVRENKNGVVPTLTANMGTGGHNVPLILTDSGEIRKLTPKETFNAQGYPKDFKLPDISNGQLYKQAGNSVVVPVIKQIATKICEAIDAEDPGLVLDPPQQKYALIFSDIDSRFKGESYVEAYANTREALEEKVAKTGIPLLSDEDYLKLVQKKKKATFYMIEEV